MSESEVQEVTSVSLPPAEKARALALARKLGTTRSRLLRAAFLALEREPVEVMRAWVAALPPDGRRGPRPRRRVEADRREEVAASP
jgi:hypothetical protein